MAEISDQQLLRAFVDHRSERAFEMLVQRFVDVVYAAAMRKIQNRALAEEVSQLVFVDLAKKAPALAKLQRGHLSSWLHKAAVFQACKLVRGEERRKRREAMFTDQCRTQLPDDVGASKWADLRPILDEGLCRLPEKDRQVIVWRYLEECSMGEVAERAGAKEAAVRKRLQRALGKLSVYCHRRQVEVSAVALASLLGQHSVEAAPAGLGASIAQSVMGRLSVQGSSAAVLTLPRMLFCLALTAVIMVGGWLAWDTGEKPLATFQSPSLPPNQPNIEALQLPEQVVEEPKPELSPKLAQKPRANGEESDQLWWQWIAADDLRSFLANLRGASFPTEVIVDILGSNSLADNYDREEAVRLLASEELDELPVSERLLRLWEKHFSETSSALATNLRRGGMPEDLVQSVLAGLEQRKESSKLTHNRHGRQAGSSDQAVAKPTLPRGASAAMGRPTPSVIQEVAFSKHDSSYVSDSVAGPDNPPAVVLPNRPTSINTSSQPSRGTALAENSSSTATKPATTPADSAPASGHTENPFEGPTLVETSFDTDSPGLDFGPELADANWAEDSWMGHDPEPLPFEEDFPAEPFPSNEPWIEEYEWSLFEELMDEKFEMLEEGLDGFDHDDREEIMAVEYAYDAEFYDAYLEDPDDAMDDFHDYMEEKDAYLWATLGEEDYGHYLDEVAPMADWYSAGIALESRWFF